MALQCCYSWKVGQRHHDHHKWWDVPLNELFQSQSYQKGSNKLQSWDFTISCTIRHQINLSVQAPVDRVSWPKDLSELAACFKSKAAQAISPFKTKDEICISENWFLCTFACEMRDEVENYCFNLIWVVNVYLMAPKIFKNDTLVLSYWACFSVLEIWQWLSEALWAKKYGFSLHCVSSSTPYDD